MKTFKKILSKTQKGFTLVELIIVITILAILGTIAFSSYRGIIESARDTNRLATLKELEKGLETYKAQTGNYPMPEGKIHTGVLSLSGILSISGVLSLSGKIDYSYMGVVGENVSSQLKLNSVPLDPLSGTNYVYATNTNRTTYQIATVFERLEAYKKPGQNMPIPGQNMKFNIFDKQELCLIQKTYANNSSYKAKVLGNHKTEVKKEYEDKVFLMTVPSMIFDPNYSNILNNSSGSYLIVNKGKNLPYKLNSSDTTANQNGNEIMQVLRENTKAKIVSIDITEIVDTSNSSDRITKINALFGTGQTDASKELLSSFGVKEADLANTSAITSKMETIIIGGTTSNYTPPTNNNCALSGQTINYGSSITAYNETSILWNAIYSCNDRKITRTCNNGTLSGDSSYQYTSCLKGTVNNCSASGSYVYNSHTYNIPAINHSTSTGNILSSIVNENNGQFKYTLTSIECNDGSYANITEATPTIQSCNSGYYISGNSCIAYVNGTCSGAPTNAVYFNDTTSYSLVNAPNLTSLTGSYLATPTENTCQYKCATNYGLSGGNCIIIPITPVSSSATNITSSSITWNWQNTANATRYEFSTNNSTWSNLGNVLTKIENTGISCGTSYTRYVRACNNDVCGASVSLNTTSASCCTPNGSYTYGVCDTTACGTNCNRAKYNSCGIYVGIDTYYNGSCCVGNAGSSCLIYAPVSYEGCFSAPECETIGSSQKTRYCGAGICGYVCGCGEPYGPAGTIIYIGNGTVQCNGACQ